MKCVFVCFNACSMCTCVCFVPLICKQCMDILMKNVLFHFVTKPCVDYIAFNKLHKGPNYVFLSVCLS